MQAFERRHPWVNFIFFACAAILSALCLHPVFIVISLVSSLAFAVANRGKAALKTFFCALLPAAVFVVGLNFLTAHYGVTVLGTLKNGNSLTAESLAYGSALAGAIVSLLLWFISFNKIMTEEKILHLTGRLFPGLTFFIMSVLRFVPMYSVMLKETQQARLALDPDRSYNRAGKFKTALASLSGVVTRALESSVETADSIKGRGYGIRRRKSYSQYKLTPFDVLFSAFMILLFVLIIILRHFGAGAVSYNPIIYIHKFDLNTAIMAVLYTLFMFTPLIYDLIQVIKWHRLYSKI